YKNQGGEIVVFASLKGNDLHRGISDEGAGIPDIEKARQAYYTTESQSERAGIGFTIMEAFMDKLDVVSNEKGGISVYMDKKLA
ncbi:MAG: ATP-binding protein, partial [Candidatus Neoclostridium sp.]